MGLNIAGSESGQINQPKRSMVDLLLHSAAVGNRCGKKYLEDQCTRVNIDINSKWFAIFVSISTDLKLDTRSKRQQSLFPFYWLVYECLNLFKLGLNYQIFEEGWPSFCQDFVLSSSCCSSFCPAYNVKQNPVVVQSTVSYCIVVL